MPNKRGPSPLRCKLYEMQLAQKNEAPSVGEGGV